MRRLIFGVLLAAAPAGCGGDGPTDVKVKTLTAEEKAQVDAQDRQVDDAEKSGSGTAVNKGKRR